MSLFELVSKLFDIQNLFILKGNRSVGIELKQTIKLRLGK